MKQFSHSGASSWKGYLWESYGVIHNQELVWGLWSMVGPHEEILILSALEQEANKQKKKRKQLGI